MLLRIPTRGALLVMLLSILAGGEGEAIRAGNPSADKLADGLPPSAKVRLGTVQLRYAEAVLSVAFSTDGKLLASATRSGAVQLADANTSHSIRELPAGTGTLVMFTPDEKHLLCAGGARGIALVDIVTGKTVRTFGAAAGKRQVLIGGASNHCAALSADGKLLAEAVGNEIILWHTDTGEEVRRLRGHTSPVYCVAFAPDGKSLAAGDGTSWIAIGLPDKGDTTIVVWRLDTGAELQRIREAHHGWIYALAFTPDGKTLASSSPYDTCLWDVKTQERLATFKFGGRSIAFSRDGKLLAAASTYGGADRGYMPIWSPSTRELLHTLRGHMTHADCLAFAPDSKTLASGGPEGTVRLWDAVLGSEIVRQQGHQAEIRSVALSADGMLAATASGGDHSIRIWGTATGAQLAKMEIACSFRSHWCATTHGATLFFAPDGKTLSCDNQVFDVRSGHHVKDYPGNVLAQSVDGKRLAITAGDNSSGVVALAVWDPGTATELARFELSKNYGTELKKAAFSPDGLLLAVAVTTDRHFSPENPSETVYLYEIASKKLLHKFRPNSGAPAFLAFSSDGEWIVTSDTWDQPVQLWSVRSGQEVRKFQGHEEHRHWAERRPSVFSPDGCLIAIAGKENRIVLFEVPTGQQVHQFQGHQGVVRAIAFGPDGKSLLSGDAATMAFIWDLAPANNQAKPAPDLDVLWEQLAAEDGPAAYRAQWRLVGAPADSVRMLKQRLHAQEMPDLEKIPKLVADLDSESYPVRAAADAALRKLGDPAEDALRNALAAKPSLETRRRVEGLLAALHRRPISPEEIQARRAMQVLEWIATPQAAEVLEVVARGAPALRTTRAAGAALRRLSARRAPAAKAVSAPPRSQPAEPTRKGTLSAAKAEVTALAFTRDGGTLAVASADGGVRLWNPLTKKLKTEIKADAKAVFAVAFSPDGKCLATAGQDRLVHLWDGAAGKQTQTLKGHNDVISAIAFTPNGKWLVSGSFDKTILLWDLHTARQVRTFSGHAGAVTSLSVSGDGKWLASGDLIVGRHQVNGKPVLNHWSDAVRLWNVANGEQVRAIAAGGQVVAFSADGSLLASAELETQLYVGGLHSIRSTGGTIGGMGEPTITGNTIIYLWDATTGESRRQLAGKGTALAFSPDGRYLVTARGSDLHLGGNLYGTAVVPAADSQLRLWEVASGQEVLAFPHNVVPVALAFAPDGRSVAAGMKDGSVELWDLAPRGDLAAKDDHQLWLTLSSEDAAAAYRVSWALRTASPKALASLEKRLLPPPATDPGLQRLIAELDDDRFQVRDEAFRELQRRGADAEAALCLGLQQASSSTVRQRLLALLALPGIVQHPELLGRSRAIAVLEAIGSAQARETLERLALGSPLSRQTQEAKAALQRMK